MKILVCGDREWTDRARIFRILEGFLEEKPLIIHGGCRGADRLAGEVATNLGFKVEVYPADWRKHGKAAGPIRNRQMLDEHPDIVIAFHNDLKNSKGTKDTVTEAIKRGIPVKYVADYVEVKLE